jgi:hypothetical protein
LNGGPAFAHRDDYIDETLVYLTLEKGEVEAEYWLDGGYRKQEDSGEKVSFLSHNLATEYGITDQWMIDGRVTLEVGQRQEAVFQSGRFETRYRFFEENEKPVDVAVSAEVNTERDEGDRQQPAIEPRLILSKDFDLLNITLNLPEEFLLRSGSTAFIPSFGLRYNATELLRLGTEVRYNTPSHEGSIIPQIWFAFPHETTLKLGYSSGLDRKKENFGRIAIEVAF